jgi:hypothetical protein
LVVDEREGGCIAEFLMQAARRMHSNVTSKLLSAASNEHALKCFDCGARTLRCRSKIFFAQSGI